MAPTADSGTPGEVHWSDGRIVYRFEDPSLLDRAMAHRSWCAEQPERLSNERLEFLGDAVLGLVHRSHAAFTDQAEDAIAANAVGDGPEFRFREGMRLGPDVDSPRCVIRISWCGRS